MSNFLTRVKIDVNFDETTFKMVGGLSIDDIKIKYLWFLNAQVQDAIIGEDENGLVWYSGDWIDGIWENGTWYSGIFHNGRWKNGNFYSYEIDEQQKLLGKLQIIKKDINKSQFLDGTWENGTFHYGIFGIVNIINEIPSIVTLEYILNNNLDYYISGNTFYNIISNISGNTNLFLNTPIFKYGIFEDGWMNCSLWKNGTFQNGFISNVIWENGYFYNGIFLGDIWENGYFYGGDFSNGIWKNGTFSTYNVNINVRFGVDYKGNINLYENGVNSITWINNKYLSYGSIWENGIFINGEFHSGLNIDSNNKSIHSIINNRSKWLNGTFQNGIWYGGEFYDGIWRNGIYHNGIIYNINWYDGTIINCNWKKGTFNNGNIESGVFETIIVKNSNIGI
jgi:hypothetical protein